jgi:aspartyl-tRNA(Asn)/glutamyl-tRNA(Gln) amidotransferase subunit A
MYVNSRTEGFGAAVKRRIMLGTYVLSAGYYDAYYKKAQKVRRLIKQDFENAFKEVNLIITPTTPTTAFKIGEKTSDPLAMYLNDIFTTPSNLSGNPSISIPAGKDDNGLPIGIQIIGKDFDEQGVLRLGNYIMCNC